MESHGHPVSRLASREAKHQPTGYVLGMSATTEIHIRPNRSWLRIDWRDLWEYRDLLFLLVKRDFTTRYKQTILGPAWFILQPLMMTLIFTIIFGKMARIPTDGLPSFLFYLCGMLAWTYFANTLNATANTFTANAYLFGKVYFPRLVIPFSAAISNFFAFAIQVATFIVFWCWFRYFTSAGAHMPRSLIGVLLLPPLVLLSAMLALGAGLWCSAATAKYKDLTHALALITQLWLYATPIIYPLSQIPERWRCLAELNPMSSIVEAFKFFLLGQGTLSLFGVLWSVGVSILLFITGVLVFHKTERTVIDTV